MSGCQRYAGAREPHRGLEEQPPRKAAVFRVERTEARGHARHGERRGADRVVDELFAERHLQLDQLGAFPRRDGAEAVEVLRSSRNRVPVDRVPAAEQPGHQRFGNARRKRRGHRGVGGVPTRSENLSARRCSRRMSGGNPSFHRA